MFAYPVTLTPEGDGGYVVTCRDIPELITQGDGTEAALENATDALDEVASSYMLDGKPLPGTSASLPGEHLIAVPVQTILKYHVRQAMTQSGLSNTAMAARMGVDEKVVRRIVDPRHNTRLQRLEKALAVLGRRPEVAVVAMVPG